MRKQKKGFTITELVIVIAVIAVLAAVLIPTFVSLVRRANESNDTQLVKNLNTALASDVNEHNTMHDAITAVADFGFDVEKIAAKATNNKILWDSKNKVFCYLIKDGDTEKIEYVPNSKTEDNVADVDYWEICDKMPTTQKYSIYASSKWEETEVTNLKVGFDAGNATNITSITYDNTAATEAQDVMIRTNGKKLIVKGFVAEDGNSGDTVRHYGDAERIDIKQIHTLSFHEFGTVLVIYIEKGRVVLEEGSSVTTVVVKTENAILESKIEDVKVYAVENAQIVGAESMPYDGRGADKYVKGEKYFEGGAGSESNPYLISQDSTLSKIPEISGCYKLISDIVLGDELRLAQYTRTIDLNGHVLSLKYGTGVDPIDNATISIRKCELTIKDTSVEQTGTVLGGISTDTETNCAIRVGMKATLNIESGNFRSTDDGASTIFVYTNRTSSSAATVNIKGGTFETTQYNGTYYVLNHQDGNSRDSKINVYAGTFINYNPGVTVVDPVNTYTGKIVLGAGSSTTEEAIPGGGTKYIVTNNPQ